MKLTVKRMRIPLPEKVEKEHAPKTVYNRREKYKKNTRDFLTEQEIAEEEEDDALNELTMGYYSRQKEKQGNDE